MYGSKGATSYGPDSPPFKERDSASGDGSVSGSKGKRSLAAVFVRHGDTDANKGEGATELVRGQTDYPLNSDGKTEATRAGRTIAAHGGASKVFHSPLSRGRDTASAIGSATGAGTKETRALLPWDKGDAEGKPVKTEDPKLRRFALTTPTKPVPGGESFSTFAQRSDGASRSIVKAGRKSVQSGGKPVAAVSHSVDMRRLPHSIEGKPTGDPLRGGVKPGEMMGVTVANKVVKVKPGMWGSK